MTDKNMKIIDHKQRYIPEERETIIRYSDFDDVAQVESFTRTGVPELVRLEKAKPEEVTIIRKYYCTDEGQRLLDGITVKLPKKWVRVRPTKISTEAQRESARRNMAIMRSGIQKPVNTTVNID